MNTPHHPSSHILMCQCTNATIIPAQRKTAIMRMLQGSSLNVTMIPDLCRAAVEGDARLQAWAENKRLTVIACHERALRLILRRAGVSLQDENPTLIDMRTLSAHAVRDVLQLETVPESAAPSSPMASAQDGWVPWYPVIDEERCTGCGQCVSFCMFGVYKIQHKRVEVIHPKSCKNNCPACARMCPAHAIVFPKSDIPGICGSTENEIAREQNGQPEGENAFSADELDRLIARRRERAEAFRRIRTAKAERSACLRQHGVATEPEQKD